ncbi:casein kinase 2 regulatory subunit [Puccinia graminis f. sp. tritici]|uniref:Casein kinase 2 regulatory subunit n=1 Tax=Puccinia graminis f. sp. tritici TaxID=56615 RepID=A0A5B0M8M4_PUCGR|nr:casein kinase 2 regulatory subunit [Puccinia graminis f. sp. tritici]KAA1135285.1 casein kinase 2 regulatory subunit [Puccinia graminis f. sp. tritici]
MSQETGRGVLIYDRFPLYLGANFGTSFPRLLFQTYRESTSILAPLPTASLSSPEPPCDLQSKSGFMSDSVTPYNSSRSKIYGPRIYGFLVSKRARSGPRISSKQGNGSQFDLGPKNNSVWG